MDRYGGRDVLVVQRFDRRRDPNGVSFVIDADGAVTLSPLYDVFSTIAYPQLTTTPGMYIDGVRDVRAVTRNNLINEAIVWGLNSDCAGDAIALICDDARSAMSKAIDDVGSAPNQLAEMLLARAGLFRSC